MKKKIAATICAAALVLALPASAFAADSEGGAYKTDTDTHGTTLVVTGNQTDINKLHVAATTETAANVPSGANVVGSFTVTMDNDAQPSETLYMTFVVNGVNSGTCDIYITHSDGTSEVKYNQPITDGTVSIAIDKLSTYTVVVTATNNGSTNSSTTTTTTTTDTSSTSPKTGVDFAGAAGITCIAVCGAGAAFAARRKINE